MGLLQSDIPLLVGLVGWAILVALLVRVLLPLWNPDLRRAYLPMAGQQHAWLAGMVALGVLWSLNIKVSAGVQLSMIGMPLYALLFGFARALCGGLITLAGFVLLTERGWSGFGIAALVMVALPAGLVSLAQQQLAARLPHNLFVFIIGNGLFVTLAAAAVTGVARLLLEAELVPSISSAWSDVIGYALLLAWGEALASGMIFAALVIFLPQVVMTYVQDDYLPRRRR